MRRKFALLWKGNHYTVSVNDQTVGRIFRKAAGNRLWFAVDETGDIAIVVAYDELTQHGAFLEFKKYIWTGTRNNERMARNTRKRPD